MINTSTNKLNINLDRRTSTNMSKLAKRYRNELTENDSDYLSSKTSNVCGFPKIHKPKEINDYLKDIPTWCIKVYKPKNLKLRLIVAGPASSTQKLNNLLNTILKRQFYEI